MSSWSKTIPVINYIFFGLSLALILGVDVPIVVQSSELSGFLMVMFVVLAVFAIFLVLENFVFSKKFASTHSGIDVGLNILIVIRNVIFLLNFIPLIQLLGLVGIFYVGWLILILYIIFIIYRFGHSTAIIHPPSPPAPSVA
jgi:hypothetical protein